ncbi:hypothetical protein LIA77_11987 [Sarocladium implicatum]|nr:hypothetical protein LIA77_11987 [Sarocladium implicatum]
MSPVSFVAIFFRLLNLFESSPSTLFCASNVTSRFYPVQIADTLLEYPLPCPAPPMAPPRTSTPELEARLAEAEKHVSRSLRGSNPRMWHSQRVMKDSIVDELDRRQRAKDAARNKRSRTATSSPLSILSSSPQPPSPSLSPLPSPSIAVPRSSRSLSSDLHSHAYTPVEIEGHDDNDFPLFGGGSEDDVPMSDFDDDLREASQPPIPSIEDQEHDLGFRDFDTSAAPTDTDPNPDDSNNAYTGDNEEITVVPPQIRPIPQSAQDTRRGRTICWRCLVSWVTQEHVKRNDSATLPEARCRWRDGEQKCRHCRKRKDGNGACTPADTYSLALYRTYLQLAFKINNTHVESKAPNQEREDKLRKTILATLKGHCQVLGGVDSRRRDRWLTIDDKWFDQNESYQGAARLTELRAWVDKCAEKETNNRLLAKLKELDMVTDDMLRIAKRAIEDEQ